MTDLKTLGEHACFGGTVSFHEHHSSACDAPGCVSPPTSRPQAAQQPVPVRYYLAGLTSTEETFMIKGGAQRLAAKHGLMLVSPDTSPRGLGLPGEDDWDFGTGAGFYLDATAEPFSRHYKMDTYVTRELPRVVAEHFPAAETRGIFGHSMGGHGALTLSLKNPDLYASVSALPLSLHPCVPPGERRRSQVTWAPTKNSGASTMPASWCAGVPSPMAGPYSLIREPQTSSSRSSYTRRSSKRPAGKQDSL
jgi:S-formylglutathione hydrolase